MTNIKGMRIYLCYTGAELCRVLPFNHGQPKEGFYTLLGQVTDEIQQGIWFRLEKMWAGDVELHGDTLSNPSVYFIAWTEVRRAILAKNDAEPTPPLPGMYL